MHPIIRIGPAVKENTHREGNEREVFLFSQKVIGRAIEKRNA